MVVLLDERQRLIRNLLPAVMAGRFLPVPRTPIERPQSVDGNGKMPRQDPRSDRQNARFSTFFA
jgi:hypothetical protein